jgi:hypothetical protein
MPTVSVEVSCPVFDSFHVKQVAGLFDVPLAERATAAFRAEVPGADENWQDQHKQATTLTFNRRMAFAGTSLQRSDVRPRSNCLVHTANLLSLRGRSKKLA